MLESSLNTSNLRTAMKIAAPQFGLIGTQGPVFVDDTGRPSTPYQPKARAQRPATPYRSHFTRHHDRGH
jgi:hypothetical protein